MAEDTDLIHVGRADVGKPIETGVQGKNFVPEDIGRVKDVGAAQELAQREKRVKAAEDVRQGRENELASGITEVEINNVRGMDQLLERHPAAFMVDDEGNARFQDSKGRPFIVTRKAETLPTLVVTQRGAVELTINRPGEVKGAPLQPIDIDHINPTYMPGFGTVAAEFAAETGKSELGRSTGISGIKTIEGNDMVINLQNSYMVQDNPDRLRELSETISTFFKGVPLKSKAVPDFLAKL